MSVLERQTPVDRGAGTERGRRDRIPRAVAAAALACALGAACAPAGDPPVPAAAAAAADVAWGDIGAIHRALHQRRGRPVLVNFWATWCAPCVEELPDLAAAAREYGGAGPAFLGVSLDSWVTGRGPETESKVRQAVARAGVSYANLIYEGDQDPLLDGFDLPGPIPYSVLYDAAGKPAATWTGPVEIAGLRRAVAALVAAR